MKMQLVAGNKLQCLSHLNRYDQPALLTEYNCGIHSYSVPWLIK